MAEIASKVESTVMFQFDDSPVKISRRDSISKLDSTWEVRALSDNFYTKVELENVMDMGHSLVCIKAPGYGSKPLKTWVKKLELELGQENTGLDDPTFWLEIFSNWKDFPGLNPKLLAVCDFLDTLQMRLTSYYEDEAFSDVLVDRGVLFPPFDGGLATMSYANFLWTKHKLMGPPGTLEEQWLDYAMDYAEHRYVWDLVARGYVLPKIDEGAQNLILHEIVPVDEATKNNAILLHQVDKGCQELRLDMVKYFTTLKSKTQRNDVAHVFSNSIETKTYSSGEMPNRNRALCSAPKRDLSQDKKAKLINLLRSFKDLQNMPGGLDVLTTAIDMHVYYLTSVLSGKRM